MPTPQGDITSTQTWDEAPAEAVEEVTEETTDESDITE